MRDKGRRRSRCPRNQGLRQAESLPCPFPRGLPAPGPGGIAVGAGGWIPGAVGEPVRAGQPMRGKMRVAGGKPPGMETGEPPASPVRAQGCVRYNGETGGQEYRGPVGTRRIASLPDVGIRCPRPRGRVRGRRGCRRSPGMGRASRRRRRGHARWLGAGLRRGRAWSRLSRSGGASGIRRAWR